MSAHKEAIRFGTDGWRGIIAREFTFDNVGRVAQALADFLTDGRRKRIDLYRDWGAPYREVDAGVVIGYDTRFLSEEFALHVARVLAGNGIPVQVSHDFVPTPTLSHAVETHGAACGVMITSSHNPPAYSGFKLKAEFGGSAPPSYTAEVERRLPRQARFPLYDGDIERTDFKTPYLKRLAELVDLERIKAGKLRVVVDAMNGSGAGCLAALLKGAGVPCVQVRAQPDPMFSGYNPEPTPQNLTPLKAVVRAQRARLQRGELLIGVVTDGDADRIGGMDDTGAVLTSHHCYSLILKHLVEEGGRGDVVKSFALTDTVDRIAAEYGLHVVQVPIGFKYVAEQMLTRDVLIGGEESGGIAVKGHVLERDGLLMALLLLEAVAKGGVPPSRLVADMMKAYGPRHYARRDLRLEERLEVVERLLSDPPDQVGGERVVRVEDLDGVKLRFADGWLMCRASGTEPLLRVYCEMNSPEALEHMHAAAGELVRSLV